MRLSSSSAKRAFSKMLCSMPALLAGVLEVLMGPDSWGTVGLGGKEAVLARGETGSLMVCLSAAEVPGMASRDGRCAEWKGDLAALGLVDGRCGVPNGDAAAALAARGLVCPCAPCPCPCAAASAGISLCQPQASRSQLSLTVHAICAWRSNALALAACRSIYARPAN